MKPGSKYHPPFPTWEQGLKKAKENKERKELIVLVIKMAFKVMVAYGPNQTGIAQ